MLMYNNQNDNTISTIASVLKCVCATPEQMNILAVMLAETLAKNSTKEEILKQFDRVLKPEGHLSIIKHNLFGRVMGSAVLGDNPQAALDLLNNGAEDSMFGNRDVYSNEFLIDVLSGEMALSETYGIRAFFGLSSNNEIKYTDDWYKAMLELENKTSTMEVFKKIAFFNHLIFEKRDQKNG